MNVKKITLLCFLFVLLTIPVSAQVLSTESTLKAEAKAVDEGWKFGGVTNLNFSQMSLSNWAAGGQNSYALNGLMSLFSHYKKESLAWDNTLDVGYGFLNQKDDPIKDFRKTDDRFEFNSKVGYKAFSNFYYSGMLNFKTQFTEGYDYKASTADNLVAISNFFAPAYLTMAVGLNYQPNRHFSVFFAPATARMTFVSDKDLRERYSVDVDKSQKTEFGGYIRTVYSKNDFEAEILKNVTFTSKLDFFSNYLEKPQNIDVNWEMLIALKVNKYLSVNLNTNLIYDDDVKFAREDGTLGGSKIQFKEVLGVGLSYNF